MQSTIVVADTSVLINFLRIDRMDLIGHHPQRFLATDHVDAEITSHYPDQRTRYRTAVASGLLDTCSVVDPDEVELFLRLRPGERLGAGECSALAVAINRKCPIAIDDNRAVKRAVREVGARLEVVKTVDVVVALIQAGVLDMPAADRIKDIWAHHHRFRIKAACFQDLL
jgi:predicted nucleic acid-binding protein